MQFAINIVLIAIGILLVIVILLQHKGAGLGAGFGGGGGPIVTKRRGVDLFLHKLTIGLSIVFFALASSALFL